MVCIFKYILTITTRNGNKKFKFEFCNCYFLFWVFLAAELHFVRIDWYARVGNARSAARGTARLKQINKKIKSDISFRGIESIKKRWFNHQHHQDKILVTEKQHDTNRIAPAKLEEKGAQLCIHWVCFCLESSFKWCRCYFWETR